jgi:hypothetical protein
VRWDRTVPPRNHALNDTNAYYAGRGSDDLRMALKQIALVFGFCLAVVGVVAAIEALF